MAQKKAANKKRKSAKKIAHQKKSKKKVNKKFQKDFSQKTQSGVLIREYFKTPQISQRKSKLKILTWNIYMMPKLGGYPDNAVRVQELKKAFRSILSAGTEPDIILFQKAFTSAEREILESVLKKKYRYFYSPSKPKKPTLNNGLWTVSKVKLDLIRVVNWKKARGAELFAAKGAMQFKGELRGKKFQIVNLHMQGNGHPAMKHGDKDTELKFPKAWEKKKEKAGKTRRKQIEQLNDEVIKLYKSKKITQFICGDFSVNHGNENYRCLTKNLKLKDGKKELISADSICKNSFARKWIHEGVQKDYILINENGGALKNSKITRKRRKIKAPFKDKKGEKHQFISYRHAIEAVIDFA